MLPCEHGCRQAERIRCSLQTPTIKLSLAEDEVSDAHHTSGLNCRFGSPVTEVRTPLGCQANENLSPTIHFWVATLSFYARRMPRFRNYQHSINWLTPKTSPVNRGLTEMHRCQMQFCACSINRLPPAGKSGRCNLQMFQQETLRSVMLSIARY